jgi:hypothetical protein
MQSGYAPATSGWQQHVCTLERLCGCWHNCVQVRLGVTTWSGTRKEVTAAEQYWQNKQLLLCMNRHFLDKGGTVLHSTSVMLWCEKDL